MSDPALAVQDAQEAALRGASSITALFPSGTVRVYIMSAPVDAPYPHIILGEAQVIGDGADCIGGSEGNSTIHVYAREATVEESRRKAMSIASAVRATLNAELTLDGHQMIDWSFETTRHLSDPDLLTAHSVVSQNYYTEPSA